ncbi:hypothetical protein [Mesorhizobium sp.]|uniref:hypothetical protein n=1 Tax=Mesorhizobium sp. TaxID=1871066 RepID=UPI0025F89A1C|nr:hypothetical protein [Mesorhizobium sp.]
MSVSNDVGALNQWRSEDSTAPLFSSRNTLALAAITAFSIVYQMRWGTIPDTSWLITVCERMLSGERLYSQIYETNPPFSVWLYFPPVAAAKLLGIAPEILVQAWTYLAALIGLSFSGIIIKRADFAETASLFAMAPAFYAVLVIFPGNVFSEREHIGIAFFMPLLALHAWRARKDAASPPSLGLAVLAGLSGSILLLIKPYYAIMVLAPALLVAAHRRSLRSFFAPEHWVIGAVCVAYLSAVTLVYPEFLRDVYPLMADVYAQIRVFLHNVICYGPTWCFLMFLIWRLWPAGRFPELAAVALAASIAGMFPLFYQAKGWAYHAYPAIFCAVATILCLLALLRNQRRSTRLLPPMAAPSRALMLIGVAIAFIPNWSTQKPDPALAAAIRTATDRPTVALIGSDMAAGHPLDRVIDGRYVSTHVSDWLGAFSLYLSRRATVSGDTAEATRYQAIMVRYAESKREEFERLRPDVVIVQKGDTYWISQLIEHFGFGAILAHYRVLVEDNTLRIYLREDYVRPGPLTVGRVTSVSSPASASD